jgi:N-acetylglucosamine-6-phosphate deacetylase
VVKEGGIVRLRGYDSSVDNTMAGSVWPLNRGVANVAQLGGVKLRDAIRMASLTPATIAGIADQKGSIEPGKDADLTVIDEQVRIYMTIVGGTVVYEAGA